MRIQMFLQVGCPPEELVTIWTLDLSLLCVCHHVLPEILSPHELLVAIITLQVLLARVDDHV